MQVALIGLGMVARTHVAAIAATNGRISLRGVMSRNAGKAAAFAEEIASSLDSTPMVYNNVQEVANDPALDFVIVATPPNERAEITSTLSRSGKHILMEKPIERTLSAASEIVAGCNEAGVKLGIVFQQRMRESAQRLAAIMDEGKLGSLEAVQINVPWWRPQSYYDEPGRGSYARDGGGVLISQAIHTLDLALTYTGAVAEVQAMARTSGLHKMESEDFVSAGLEFESGAVGSLVATTCNYPGSGESITLNCQHATAVLKTAKLDILWHDGKTETFGSEGASGGGADPMAFTHEWHQAIIEDFADAIVQDRQPAASGEQALSVHQLIDALIESSSKKHAIRLSATE
ncbi:MAG: Gfo/Idh/MocA family oxidoreductase [Stappiaceae bacterium]